MQHQTLYSITMEWISSTDFIKMLKRFPNTKINARRYLCSLLASMHTWEYQSDLNSFFCHLNGKTTKVTERQFLKQFASDHWRPEQFFFLKSEEQKALAVRLVEHLIMTGSLDWIICDCNVNFLRQCDHCHKLMDEGWMCGETYHYCSDECLLAENPGITQAELDNLVVDDDSDIYWTEWED